MEDTKHVYVVCLNYKRQWVFESRNAASRALFQFLHRHGLRVNEDEKVTLEQVQEKVNAGEFLFITSPECVQEIYVETVPLNPDIEFPYQLEHPV